MPTQEAVIAALDQMRVFGDAGQLLRDGAAEGMCSVLEHALDFQAEMQDARRIILVAVVDSCAYLVF